MILERQVSINEFRERRRGWGENRETKGSVKGEKRYKYIGGKLKERET